MSRKDAEARASRRPPAKQRAARIKLDLLACHRRGFRRTWKGWTFCVLGWHRFALLDSGWIERCRDCGAVRLLVDGWLT